MVSLANCAAKSLSDACGASAKAALPEIENPF